MTAFLSEQGFDSRVIDFNKKRPEILRTIRRLDPLLIGFSIIFHEYIAAFAELINYLRTNGINCHITAGGHYASLRYNDLFRLIPGIDTIVRFEGEYPIVNLAKCISEGKNWKNLENIAYKENNEIISNAIMTPERDLDKFPFPLRYAIKDYAFKRKYTTILAGRGCIYDCSFCNTREFYRQACGPIKRIRKPEQVVREMEYLLNKKGCSVFIFEDDDFPVNTYGKSDWIYRFCGELERKSLNEKIIWKINCRPDEIDEEKFSLLKRNGLFMVFLGIEDGTDPGLKRLNKNMTIAQNLNGISILKKLKIDFDFGFMLFQPATTFMTLNLNLDFLKEICSDGYSPATFLRLVPFYDTRVERELAKEGRLKIYDDKLDYDFYEERMNLYYTFISDCFHEWLEDRDGVENISKWARNYFSVYFHFYDTEPVAEVYHCKLTSIISEANIFMVDILKELALIFESELYQKIKSQIHQIYIRKISSMHSYYKAEIYHTMACFMSFAGQSIIV